MADFIRAFQQYPYLYITATYAAIISSIALVWDIVKHKQQQATLKINAQSGLKLGEGAELLYPTMPESASASFIVITVTNTGVKTTTVTHLSLVVFSNRLMYWLNKPSVTFIISLAVQAMRLPHKLETGIPCTWSYQENDGVMSQAKGKLLYVIVSHSMSPKQCYSRVRGPNE